MDGILIFYAKPTVGFFKRYPIKSSRQEGNLNKFPDLSHHRTYGSVYGGSINLTSNTPFGVVI